MELLLQDMGFPEKEKEKPWLIAGPCSAETEEHTLAVAHALAQQGVQLFRCGIWKPRTRPGVFEGVGRIGLPWLQRVKEETGMMVCIEVANASHVEEALKYGIDVLWIGARTTTNPFAVQEIANALKGVDLPVLVKNPVNPDIELWIGALERIYAVGVHRLGVIHRGFSSYNNSRYRNQPEWQIPIELKRRLPDLPIFVDPSHIGGKRDIIGAIAQEAMNLNFDGLMIETHLNPDKAWSDAIQQITPDQLSHIMQQLLVRSDKYTSLHLTSLQELRKKIDLIDVELIHLLKRRMETSCEIGKYKSQNNIPVFQNQRYSEFMLTYNKLAKQLNLNPEFITKIYEFIHKESIRCQNEVMKSSE